MKFVKHLAGAIGPNKATVLTFHKVPLAPEDVVPDEPGMLEFRKIVDFVATRFPIVSLDTALHGVSTGSLEPGSVCLTFDDGYVEWLDTVAPFLKARGLPATCFITTGQLDGQPLWHERLRHVIGNAKGTCIDVTESSQNGRLSLSGINDRQRAVRRLEQFLKERAVSERNELIDKLEFDAGLSCKQLPCMTEAHVRTLHRQGFAIGAHSVHHPILTQCNDEDAAMEIRQSKDRLEAIIGQPVKHFAYPNGYDTDYNARHIAMVKHAGYEIAFTTQSGAWSGSSDKYQLPRFTPWGPGAARMSWQFLRNLVD
jgi:peptidoglycan/xylan/chitin deacetylase (PgdA/CDA1 family)